MPESSYLQRAELLAELGRFDEAAAELAQAEAADAPAQTLLARVRLAVGTPKQALAAADAAVAAAPADLAALIVRGRALAALGRVDDATAQAEQVLRRGRGNGAACTGAAAILAEVRVGQVALDAAWEGVRLAPEQPGAHLVLGVVAVRLGLDDVAERAYQEALALDPELSEPDRAEQGLLRLEQHRYAAALGRIAKADRTRSPAEPGPQPALESPEDDLGGIAGGSDGLRRTLQYAVAYALVAPLLAGWAYVAGTAAPLVAVLLAGVGTAGLLVAYRRFPEEARAELPARLQTDRRFALAAWAVLGVPLLLSLFALFGSPWLLVAAAAAGAGALLAGRPRS